MLGSTPIRFACYKPMELGVGGATRVISRSNIYNECILFWKDGVLGFVEYEQSKRKQFYVVNLILLLAKFHIHRCKYSNFRPLFFVFIK